MKKQNLFKGILSLLFLLGGGISAWGTDVLTFDCATPAPTGTTSTELSSTSNIATFLNSAAGLSSADSKITCSSKSGNVYKGKGNGGGDIPQKCLKVGKASGGGAFTFTIPNTYDEVDEVEITCYGWNTTSSISINSGTAQTFTTKQVETTKSFKLASSTRTIAISVTTSAVCITSIVLKKADAATTLAVKTAPTKVNYKVGEKLDLTGLVLSATVGGNDVDVTSGYSAKIGETAVTSGTTALNTVGAQTITFTYGGQTTTQTIHVGTLQSIAVTTSPTKTTYNQGQDFDTEGMVVKATFSDEEETPTTWQETIEAGANGYIVSPSTNLAPANTSVTVSYTWNAVEKATTQDITVNAKSAYTVTFNAGRGTCGTASLTETNVDAGITLPSASCNEEWTFAGWAEESVNTTTNKPTLYAAAYTYYPSENITLYAVYVTNEGKFVRATSVDEVTCAGAIAVVHNQSGKYLYVDSDGDVLATENAPTGDKITPDKEAIFTFAGNNTDGFTLTCDYGTLGATGLSNTNVSMTSTNNKWIVEESKETGIENCFVLRNGSSTNAALEHFNNGLSFNWKVYGSSTYSSSDYYTLRIYYGPSYSTNPDLRTKVNISNFTATTNPIVKGGNTTTTVTNDQNGWTAAYTYESGDETIATVNNTGVITGVAKGTTTITVSLNMDPEDANYQTGTTTSYELEIDVVNPTHTATFKANGTTVSTKEVREGDAITFPTEEPTTLGNKAFVGWTTTENYSHATDAPTLVEEANMGETNVTYYAVFATGVANGPEIYTKLTSTNYDANAQYVIGANQSSSDDTKWYFYTYTAADTNQSWGSMTTSPQSNTPIKFTLSGSSNSITAVDASGNYLKYASKNFVMSSTSSTIKLDTDGAIMSGTNRLRHNYNNGAGGLRWYDTTTGVAAYFFKCEKSVVYSDFSTTNTANVIIEDELGNKTAKEIDLTDDIDVTALVNVHADAITYTRTMGKLSTLYLPYASTIPTGMTAYEFNGINDAGTALNFTAVEGSTLEAYTPYVLEQNTSAAQTLNATDVDIVADTHGTAIKGTWTFKGTAEVITNADLMTEAGTGTAFIVQSDGKWHHVEADDAVYIPAFRAYFISSEANGAKLIDMNLGGETTGIDALNNDASTTTDNAPAYNLAGQKVGSSYKGIVVVNGKKVVRK